MVELKAQLTARALELGFHRVGVARVEPLGVEAERLNAWLAEGRHGVMSWMAETAEVRGNIQHVDMLPSARSVVVLATSYARSEEPIGPAPLRVARYAQGRDYHNVFTRPLRKLAKLVRSFGHTARHSVDTMPVFERAWAQRAGLGFIGKNACLIVPGLGSHVLLSTLITSAELAPDAPMKERCGSCTACLDRCPTRAFVAERQLDARRCISYLTIEHSGPVPSELREPMGSWMFGCDVCQDVCPFNRTSPLPAERTAPFEAHERWHRLSAARVLELTADEFASYAAGSPLQRPGREGVARNIAIGLANTRDKRHLPVLRRVAANDASTLVRETASWACDQLDS
ncbi:MAG TPA: tRNA epoxyqueuosine(34) reductase QueG [Polyangiales bacterium]|nr:tRNA epoxyqueuosine(34) reductase QueG [Polyangiales bacterium]